MATPEPLNWRARRWLWSRWQTLRFALSKPQKIGPPEIDRGQIASVPLGRVQPLIPLENVRSFDHLPRDEAGLGMRVLTGAGIFLNRLLPPKGRDLPEIDDDIDSAIARAIPGRYRDAFRAPVLPDGFDHAAGPDLAELAVRGPYAPLLERGDDGRLVWDLTALGRFEHHEGLCSLGVRVEFDDRGDGHLATTRIEGDEYGVVSPTDADWNRAVLLALCAANTQLALTRHYNYVHLIGGDHWAIATRNHLQPDHPVFRLLWPHIFNSLYTIHGTLRTQLLPDGDFVNIYSLTHRGLIAYFDAMYERYDVRVTDPDADHERRGLAGTSFAQPSHQNLRELSGLMVGHADRYLSTYYGDDEAIANDAEVGAWLTELSALIPNGIEPLLGDQLTRDGLARLIGGHIYEGNTIHDLVGTTLWDYQPWADCCPPRVRRDGRRVPVDVYQRAIDNNFALQIRRARLLDDYGTVALDPEGAAVFARFAAECAELQDRYDRSPGGPWRMEPKNLEIGMNG